MSCSGFFVSFARVKIKPAKAVPVLIVLGAVGLLLFLRCLDPDLFERVERMTYDMRVRAALRQSAPAATNLGFVYIDEQSVKSVWDRSVGLHYWLLWPRDVYGRLVDELSQQNAKAVGLDIIFDKLRDDLPEAILSDGTYTNNDVLFAMQMRRASNVVIAATKDTLPPALFLTNAAASGHIWSTNDSDGVLRRAQAFIMVRRWDSAFRQVEADPDYGVDLRLARVERDRIVLPRQGGPDITFPLDANGNFDRTDFGGDKLPAGTSRHAKPFTEERVWHMGIVLAAMQLGLDLDHAEVDLEHGRITLRGKNNLQRVIPVDREGYFFIDWSIPPNDHRLTKEAIESLLAQYFRRLNGETNGFVNRWEGKLVFVGSGALEGNNIADTGATPFSQHTLLVGKHWNVANSVITGHFVRRAGLGVDLALLALLGFVVALLATQAPVLRANLYVAVLCIAYVIVAFAVYVQSRFWIPVFMPLLSALFSYLAVVAWRLVFEEAERRRIKSVFGTVVSPKILDVLLDSPSLSLGGARRQITVMFADVRGFTELTDTSQARVAEYVRSKKLQGEAAEKRFDQQARETLETVNTYLGIVADTILSYDATIDKFIGDCVMAFWGAPAAQPNHALLCVRAAMAAQLAIHELNLQRATENQKRELENLTRVSAGLEPMPLLPILLLGTGINTGMATVGLMGSGARQKSYTVFGREVNLASRLEGLSGRGRIFISESTFEALKAADPALAATCLVQPPAKVKGISGEVIVYDVPWRPPGAPLTDIEAASSKTTDSTVITSIIQRG